MYHDAPRDERAGFGVLQVFEPPDGGVADHVARLSQGLFERGIGVAVAGPRETRIRASLPDAVGYYPLPFGRTYGDPRREVAALRSLRHALSIVSVDVVHVHSSKAGVLGRLAAGMAGVPCVYTPHCFPFIGEVTRRRQVLGVAIERALAPLAARTICVSRDERAQALMRGVGSPGQLEVIHNGVDPCPEAKPDPDLTRFAGGRPLVGTVAVHRRQKGIDRLIEAVVHVLDYRPDVRFAIVGDGPLLSHHLDRAEELGVASSIMFAPFIPPAARYLRALDLFVLPSRWEGLPLALLEAMACGTPVLASEVGGTAEALADDAGALFHGADASELAVKIARLVASPEERASLARRAALRVSTGFSVERMIDQTIEVYHEVTGVDRTPSPPTDP